MERLMAWRSQWGDGGTGLGSEAGGNFADELRRQRWSMKWAGGNAGCGGDRCGVEGRGRKGDPEMVGKGWGAGDGEQLKTKQKLLN